MFKTVRARICAYIASQRIYLVLGIMCLVASAALTANALVTVSDSGLLGNADVVVDATGTLNLGTASSTAVVIGSSSTPVTIAGALSVVGPLTLGSASTTGQLVFRNASSSFVTVLQPSLSQTSNLTFTLPNATGTPGQAILTDGTGNLYFGSAGSSQWISTSTGISYSDGSVTIGTTVLGSDQQIDIKCSGNITAQLQAAIQTLLGSSGRGGTIQLSTGSCYVTALDPLPNDATQPVPSQKSLRITGRGAGAHKLSIGVTTAETTTQLDLREADAVAKIDSRGYGRLEIDHLSVVDSGSDCSAFIQVTNTAPYIHDATFTGTASGSSACNDAVILGGTSQTDDGTENSVFTGYGGAIERNYFDKIRRGVYLRSWANAVPIRDNAWSKTCGSNVTRAITAAVNGSPTILTIPSHGLPASGTISLYISGGTGSWAGINGTWPYTYIDDNTVSLAVDSTSWGALTGSPAVLDGAAVEIDGTARTTNGNLIEGNTVEMPYYPHFAVVKNSIDNRFIANGLYDQSPMTSSYYRFESTAPNNLVLDGYADYTTNPTPLIADFTDGRNHTWTTNNTQASPSQVQDITATRFIARDATAGHAACVNDQLAISYCTTQPDANGVCTCAGSLGPNIVGDPHMNGGWWSTDPGWSVANGVATRDTTAGNNTLYRSTVTGLTKGITYRTTFTIKTIAAGSFKMVVCAGGSGTARTTAGTFAEDIQCPAGAANTNLNVYSTGGQGTVDDVIVRRIY